LIRERKKKREAWLPEEEPAFSSLEGKKIKSHWRSSLKKPT